jgi:hypothetical protein
VARTRRAFGQLRARVEAVLSARLSPERTRRATLLERLTVQRLGCAPIEGALVLAILLPTLVLLAARSILGFARWRLQRELWRRDVERLEAVSDELPEAHGS